MSNGTGDIIIKGSSAEVEFDDAIYEQDPQNPHRYQNGDKKIVRVLITGDISFDSGENAGGYQCKIIAFCK